jgi:hypothetical protein
MSFEQEAVREYTRHVGAEHPDQEWILSPFDSWEKNPFYTGKPGRHPEDDYGDES